MSLALQASAFSSSFVQADRGYAFFLPNITKGKA
jgi:hypothetical protein